MDRATLTAIGNSLVPWHFFVARGHADLHRSPGGSNDAAGAIWFGDDWLRPAARIGKAHGDDAATSLDRFGLFLAVVCRSGLERINRSTRTSKTCIRIAGRGRQ